MGYTPTTEKPDALIAVNKATMRALPTLVILNMF